MGEAVRSAVTDDDLDAYARELGQRLTALSERVARLAAIPTPKYEPKRSRGVLAASRVDLCRVCERPTSDHALTERCYS